LCSAVDQPVIFEAATQVRERCAQHALQRRELSIAERKNIRVAAGIVVRSWANQPPTRPGSSPGSTPRVLEAWQRNADFQDI